MKTHFISEKIKYDGSQLRSLFAYMRDGVHGDSIVAWRGPCDIPSDKVVDGEDLRANSAIRGEDMVHFIIEVFGTHLVFGVALQRLMASIVKDYIEANSERFSGQLFRVGDDIYLEGAPRRKLSISIASASPVSVLIHFAVNVIDKGTPVPTVGIQELGFEPKSFALEIMSRFSQEYSDLVGASQKVFPLK